MVWSKDWTIEEVANNYKAIGHIDSDDCEQLISDSRELAALREELAEANRYKNLFEQSEKTIDRVHCMYAKRLLEATGERQTVLIPDEEFVRYFEEIKAMKASLTAAEQRNAELIGVLEMFADNSDDGDVVEISRHHIGLSKPTELGENKNES